MLCLLVGQGQDLQRFNELQQDLSTLSTNFSNNLVAATAAFKLVVTDKSQVGICTPSLLHALHAPQQQDLRRSLPDECHYKIWQRIRDLLVKPLPCMTLLHCSSRVLGSTEPNPRLPYLPGPCIAQVPGLLCIERECAAALMLWSCRWLGFPHQHSRRQPSAHKKMGTVKQARMLVLGC